MNRKFQGSGVSSQYLIVRSPPTFHNSSQSEQDCQISKKIDQSQTLWSLEGSIILECARPSSKLETHLLRAASVISACPYQPGTFRKTLAPGPFPWFFVDHQSRSDTAVGVTAAADLSPFGFRSVNQIGKIRKGSSTKSGTITSRLSDADCSLTSAGHMRQVYPFWFGRGTAGRSF